MASVHKSAAPSAPPVCAPSAPPVYDLAASYGQEQTPPVYSQATPPPSYGQKLPPPVGQATPPPSYGQELPPPVYGQATPPPSYGQARPPPMTGVPAHVQPSPPAAQALGVPGQWSSGLCDCCSDVTNCCITCWCPCITFGQIAEIVDKGSIACGVSGALYALIAYATGCPCIYSCFYRSKMRRQYMLAEEPCGDCLVHCCCESCALCQEYRELRHCGFDMSLGWAGNMDKQNFQGDTMPPLVQGGMYR